jgi:hypothetical protein
MKSQKCFSFIFLLRVTTARLHLLASARARKAVALEVLRKAWAPLVERTAAGRRLADTPVLDRLAAGTPLDTPGAAADIRRVAAVDIRRESAVDIRESAVDIPESAVHRATLR